MAGSITDYSDATTILSDWLKNIAPKYFDFEQTNSFRTGVFGYVNEVMSTVNEDTFNAVTIARREFYPTKAEYTSSLYSMAALHELAAPMSVPAQVHAILVIKEVDLLPLLDSNTNSYTIDDNIVFSADTIPFMLDHPIIITSNHSTTAKFPELTKDSIAYTIRYDTSGYKNSLDTSNRIYLQNKVISHQGERLILINVILRQVTVEETTVSINKNAHINVVNQDIPITGNIANFEVFYKEANSEISYQLTKVLMNGDNPTTKFCKYMMVNENTLRLNFPANNYFTPAYNSQITVRVYTTLGASGNFAEYRGNLSCSIGESNTLQTNSKLIIDGSTMGASTGGYDRNELANLRADVEDAYATNGTICTDNDLQRYWDKKNTDTNNKVLFFKKRDDAFSRLYGAFMLLRDSNTNVIPSNTLTMLLNQGIIDEATDTLSSDSDFSNYYAGTDRLVIKPGYIFRYSDNDTAKGGFTIHRDSSLSLNLDTSEYEKLCDYINGAIQNIYSNTPVTVTEESAYSFLIQGTTTDDFKKSVSRYIYSYYGYDITDSIDEYISIISNPVFTSYADAFIYAQSNQNSYTGELLEVTENGTTTIYRVTSEKALVSVTTNENVFRVRISYFLFTNPYLISIMRKPNAVAYYLNSMNKKFPVESDRIQTGDKAFLQFIMNNIYVSRNAILGENFYKFNITISPSIDDYDLESITVKSTDTSDESNIIRAPADGHISIIQYENEDSTRKILKPGTNTNGTPITESDTNAGVFATIICGPAKYKIRVSSSVYCTSTEYTYYTGWNIQYSAYSSFNKNDAIAIMKDVDLGELKMTLQINPGSNGYSSMFIPMVLDSYDKENDYYTFTGYVATDDEITVNNTFHFTRGVFQTTATNGVYGDSEVPSKSCYIDTSNGVDLRACLFIKYDDFNYPEEWINNSFVTGISQTSSMEVMDGSGIHTFTNEYKFASDNDPFQFMSIIKYIRSTSLVDYVSDTSKIPAELLSEKEKFENLRSKYVKSYADGNISFDELMFFLNGEKLYTYKDVAMSLSEAINAINEEIATLTGGTTTYTIKGVPVLKAEWIKNTTNSQYVVNAIENNYTFVDQVYQYLENNFSIDMKFYNTYGRSRFYRVGLGNNTDNMQILDRVNCSFKFGVKIDSTTTVDTFKTRFCEYVKSYIESINNIESEGKPIYIMSLIAALKEKFGEIIYLEYYGMNNYDHSVQKVTSNFDDVISNLGYNEYVPEFINANGVNNDFEIEPAVELTFLS